MNQPISDMTADAIQKVVAATIQRSKDEIQLDIARGKVPASVVDFGTLHDFVDANCYGGLCDDDDPFWGYDDDEADADRDLRQALASAVQDAVHDWLVEGRPASPTTETGRSLADDENDGLTAMVVQIEREAAWAAVGAYQRDPDGYNQLLAARVIDEARNDGGSV